MLELLHLPYSPWSEKARWALDLRGLAYKARLYQPLFGEPELRILLKRLRGPVSVPLLRADGRVFADSLEIARYADAHGSGPRLFPAGQEASVERYNELSERGLRAGRALALARVLEDPDALLELVPRGLRKVLGARAVDISRAAVKRTLHKYGSDRVTAAGHERALCEVLDALRTGLARSSSATEPRTLFGELSYADLAMAQVLGFVDPPSSLRIARNNRHAFTDTRVAALYPDLIAWRNALYSAYRAAPHSP